MLSAVHRPAAVLVVLASLALIGCSQSAESKRLHREAECSSGLIHDRACEEQKNREARVKEAEKENEAAREGERLKE